MFFRGKKRDKALAKHARLLKEREQADFMEDVDRYLVDKVNASLMHSILQDFKKYDKVMRPCEQRMGTPRPRNVNVCVAEGCFNEECLDIQKENQ